MTLSEEDDRCRLCSGNSSLVDIFSIPNAKEKIKDLLHIYVCEEDFVSKFVCFRCYGLLDRFDEFVRSSQANQTELLKAIRGIDTTASAVNDGVVSATINGCSRVVAPQPNVVPGQPELATDDKPQVQNAFVQELSDDEQSCDTVPLIELMSDDSCEFLSDMECDSDVEFVDIKPFPLPLHHLVSSQSQLFLKTEDSKAEIKTEFKPEILKNRLVYHENLQVGNAFLDDYAVLLNEQQEKSPSVPLDQYELEQKHISKKGSSISTDQGLDKGCQIEITFGLRHKSTRPRFCWSRDQKEEMRTHFFHFYQNFDIPTQQEIVDFLDCMDPHLFHDIHHKQVKQYFQNRRSAHHHYMNHKNRSV